MIARAYYNENDPFCVEWLRNLIRAGLICNGEVDERDIRDVAPSDLLEFTQCHFFAGIGVWSLALRFAGWPDDRPVWTGSCPCQPFSQAGRRRGFDDERHLWPAWHHLASVARPHQIYGEQVASPDGRTWLDVVSSDLEGIGYAVGSVEFPACGVGAFHIRQRIWFVAKSDHNRLDRLDVLQVRAKAKSDITEIARSRAARRMGNSRLDRTREHARKLHDDETEHDFRKPFRHYPSVDSGAAYDLGNADLKGLERRIGLDDDDGSKLSPAQRASKIFGRISNWTHTPVLPNLWEDPDWVYCRDEKYRPIEPGTLPLADGTPARVGRLRAYGNAISPQAAAEIIRASM